MADVSFSIDVYCENYEMQVAEIEILQSMFADPGELDIDPRLVHDVVNWVNREDKSDLEPFPAPIEFIVRLKCDEKMMEVIVALPPEYPKILPEVYIRSNHLSRTNQTLINEEIGSFLENETLQEEPNIVPVISWIQEHAKEYFVANDKTNIDAKPNMVLSGKFLRYWIYSHHIYSKNKRKNLRDLALELGLTGFCMPGKPGIICIEGILEHVADWWTVVRNWNWKKITVKVQEELDDQSEKNEKKNLFERFEEIGLLKDCQRGNHMDMGEFYRYLEAVNSAWVFKDLFGIEKD